VWEVIAVEVRADGWKICHFSPDSCDPTSGVMVIKVAFE
jgi:hypothetical protein